MDIRSRSPKTIAAYFLLAVSLAIFGFQLRTLYTVPVFDSVRWGGDESWLMREFGNQAMHGVMAYPESYVTPQGHSVPRTDGVLAGSMWADALLYGVPGIIFFPAHDYISIGRTVTAILALSLILSTFFILSRLGVSPLICSLCILLMVSSQGFVWASHSERYDLLTGLTLIWYCYFLSGIKPQRSNMLIAGIASVLILCFSRHLLLLGLPATLIFLWSKRVWKSNILLLSWIAGAVGTAIVLSLAYVAGAHEFSLFGRGGVEGSYGFVLNQIPIFRPFSRNVQLSNLEERFHLFETDMPGMIFSVVVVLLLLALYKLRQWRLRHRGVRLSIAITQSQRFFLYCAFFCTGSWLLTEGSRPYYLFHVVPIMLMSSAIVLELWSDVFAHRWFGEHGAIAVLIIAVTLGMNRAIPNPVFGNAVANDQQTAIHRMLSDIPVHPSKRILCDVAGLDRALWTSNRPPDSNRQILTLDMFQPPASADALVKKLDLNHIDYVILRSSPVGTPFEPGRALLPRVLDSIGIVQDSAMGFFYDDGRSYDAGLTQLIDQGLDTLRLYRVRL